MRRAPSFVLLAVSIGCSSSSSTPSGGDASVAPSPDPLSIVRAATDLGHGARVSLEDHGYRVTARPARGGSLHVFRSAWLPAKAEQPLRVEVSAGEWLEVSGALATAPRLDGDAIVARDVAKDTDAVYAVLADGIEELRVLRSAAAPTDFTWTLRLGPGLGGARVRDGKIEVFDANGTPRIESAPLVAIDAHGKRRELSVQLDGLALHAKLDVAGLAYPIVVDPKWTPTAGSLTYNKISSPLVRLASGKVLAVGSGVGGTGAENVESYDPATGKWTTAGKLLSVRTAYTATLLASGKVLVAGGLVGATPSSTAEVYDPATSTSTATGSLAAVRVDHVAALLPDGRVLVAAGGSSQSGPPLGSAEIWDPSFGTWSPAPSMTTPRTWTTASVLNGKVVVASGGLYGSTTVIANSETYDPGTNSWSTQTMTAGRRKHIAVVLGNKLWIGGGETPSQTATTAFFDGATWAAKASMSKTRSDFVGAPLPDGRLLVATKSAGGGYGDNTSEIWDPIGDTWTTGPSLASTRYSDSAIPLIGGRVLVVGGYAGGSTSSEIFFPDPKVCATGADCPSGTPCVDNYCCNTTCTGQCEACDVSGQEGVCTPVVGAPHGKTSCGTYLCDPSIGTSGACATSCLTTGACSSGNYCSVGSCVTQKTDGSTCALSEECTSGNCVDGICCSTACTGACQACDVAGSLGTCSNVASGPPHASHTCGGYACSSGSCLTTCTTDANCDSKSWCSGTTCIPKRTSGTACGASHECATGNCVDSYCCDSSCTGPCSACDVAGKLGTCSAVTSGSPHGTRTCAPALTCGATGCVLTCSTDAQCAPGNACIGGICKGKKANGIACSTSTECTTGNCVDGVCCDTTCTGACKACNLAGTLGTCTAVDGAADPHKVCASTGCADVCKAGACAFKSATTVCGTPSCAGGIITSPHCSGTDETCVAGSASACAGGLGCADDKNCKIACTSAADCASGTCDIASGLCVSGDAGTDSGSDTGTDAVADTDVPETATTDTGSAPVDTGVAPTDTGTDIGFADMPAPKLGDHPSVGDFQRCSKASDCATGFCVEGVCCDSACNDRCHSCALLTSPGKCTLEPIGVDLKQECGPANQCLGTCGSAGECVGSGTGTECARNRCVDSTTGVGPAYCASPGGKCDIGAVVPFDCAPYICEPAFGACRSNCVTSTDCARDFVCDVGTKTCVAAPAASDGATGSDGGGGCSTHGPGSKAGAGLLLALALAATARRRSS
ncbi:MAG: Kelch repeat-containing protein [Polyangiales bacterium]